MSKTRRSKSRVFSEKDYQSGDGLLTKSWGPGQWHFLHAISFNYPVSPTEQDKKHYRDYVLSLVHVLPCKYCRMNLRKNLKKAPITMAHMKNRDTFSKYVYDLHEIVNTMLNKKSGLTYEDVKERYEHFRARCSLPIKRAGSHQRRNNTRKRNSEKGCTEPLYGEKIKCVLKFLPENEKCDTFQMDKRCLKRRGGGDGATATNRFSLSSPT